MRTTDDKVLVCLLTAIPLAFLLGGLVVHGIWLHYHGDEKCHPVPPALTVDQAADVLLDYCADNPCN